MTQLRCLHTKGLLAFHYNGELSNFKSTILLADSAGQYKKYVFLILFSYYNSIFGAVKTVHFILFSFLMIYFAMIQHGKSAESTNAKLARGYEDSLNKTSL